MNYESIKLEALKLALQDNEVHDASVIVERAEKFVNFLLGEPAPEQHSDNQNKVSDNTSGPSHPLHVSKLF